MSIIRLNTIPSRPDSRDLVYKLQNIKLPEYVDLRSFDSRIELQGNLGSCTAVAITSAYEVMINILYPNQFIELSSLFVYYHSRLFSSSLETDSGSYIRDGLKSVKNYGVCSDLLWPYSIEKFSLQPPPNCYLDAAKRKITQYNILYSNDEIKEVLAGQRPVVLGIEVFSSFNNLTKENPQVPMPVNYSYSLGGHAVLIMGYNDQTGSFLIKNSYSKDWGDNGYGWLPYDYVDNYAFERWCFEIDNPSTIN